MGVWGFVCGFDFDMKNEMLVIIFLIFGMGGGHSGAFGRDMVHYILCLFLTLWL